MGVRTGNVVRLSIACSPGSKTISLKRAYSQKWCAILLPSTGLKKEMSWSMRPTIEQLGPSI